jgi:uncharacterized membrane protein
MTMAVLAWLIAIPLLGAVTGLRTLTPMAVLCWFAYLGHLPVDGTWAFWSGKFSVAIVFTVLAVGEYIGDKLPNTPNRISLFPLITRLVFGGLMGAIVATGLDGSAFEGILLGTGGALVGAFAGYLIRRELVQRLECKDWYIAVAEDVLAVVCAILAMGVVTG